MVVDRLKGDKALANEQINVLKDTGHDVVRNGPQSPEIVYFMEKITLALTDRVD